MNEMTEAGEKAKGGKGKGKGAKGNAAEPMVDGQIGRMLVRAIWTQEWSAANPDGKPEERKAAWQEARSAAMDKNLKAYRRALTVLARSGVVVSIEPGAAAATGNNDDTGEDA